MKGLFISHAASRTGAPKILVYLLRYLRQYTDIEIEILLRTDGEIRPEFEELGPTYVWKHANNSENSPGRLARLLGKSNNPNPFIDHFDKANYDLVYVNSAAASDLLNTLGARSVAKFVFHVHELEFNLKTMVPEQVLKNALERSDKVIAVSELVRNNLLKNHDLVSDKVALVYEFIPEITAEEQQEDIREKHGIKADEMLVGASGLMNWRKGTDMFLLIAQEVKKRGISGIRFLWLGGNPKNKTYLQAQIEHEKLGLDDSCILVTHVDNSFDYQRAFDVFLMVSREDPFPLVAIENGQFGHPIFCFKGCTGTEEFIDESCGGVIDYMDISTMADKIIELKQDPALLKAKGEEVERRFSQFNLEKAGAELVSLLKSL